MENQLSLLQQVEQDKASQLEAYFHEVLRLQQSGDPYPVDLDKVWPIVYSRKDKAVRALKEEFMEGVDYQLFPTNGENSNGGRPEEKYRISSACMEFLIARKIRDVFEIYRKVFHKATSKPALPENYLEALKALVASEEAKQLAQAKVAELEPKAEFFDAAMASVSTMDVGEMSKIFGIPKMGRTTLFKFLRDNGVLTWNNRPYQKHVEAGRCKGVEVTENGYVHFKPVFFQKGVDYVFQLLKSKGYSPNNQ